MFRTPAPCRGWGVDVCAKFISKKDFLSLVKKNNCDMKKKKSKIHLFTVEQINELASAFINIAREHFTI
jgi:hypothetical protein